MPRRRRFLICCTSTKSALSRSKRKLRTWARASTLLTDNGLASTDSQLEKKLTRLADEVARQLHLVVEDMCRVHRSTSWSAPFVDRKDCPARSADLPRAVGATARAMGCRVFAGIDLPFLKRSRRLTRDQPGRHAARERYATAITIARARSPSPALIIARTLQYNKDDCRSRRKFSTSAVQPSTIFAGATPSSIMRCSDALP